MKNKANYIGMLLRTERLRQGLELGDVSEGICAASYLCKIELGQAQASAELMKDLLNRLGLEYEQDEDFLAEMQLLLDRVYEAIYYQHDIKQELKLLREHKVRIRKSPLRLSYDITESFMEEKSKPELEALQSYMDDRELAVYLLSHNIAEERPPLEHAKRVSDLLQNSFGLLVYMQACLWNNRFAELKSLGDHCSSLALSEGNLYVLIQVDLLTGTAYASEGYLAVAITYYKRAAHFIKNSIWPSLVSGINYNLGATYLELGDLARAAELLVTVPRSYGFYLFHKLAWLALATADREAAQHELKEMKRTVGQDRSKKLIYAVTAIQLRENFASEAASLQLVEELIDCLKETKHIGFLRFHRELITKVFIAHRKYKKAYEYEKMLGDYTRQD
ncbi:MAG TPA: hypothetical protein GXZ59_08375 [Clostridiaceae bacterium]|nr:hypothetical protein [Clostridiaceae bacterium]